MLRAIFLFLFFSFLFSCGQGNYSSETPGQDINLKDLTEIAPQQTIQNPLNSINTLSFKDTPKYVEVIGKSVDVDVSLKDFSCIKKGDKNVCVYSFNFTGGKGGRIHFKDMNLPPKSYIVVFDDNFKEKYTEEDKGEFWSVNFQSETVYIAFVYPVKKKLNASPFKIDKVSYIWGNSIHTGDISPAFARPTECETIDVKCETNTLDNDVWRFAKSSAMIILSYKGYTYQCSGNLIQTKKDKNDPILITAKHCIPDKEALKDAVFWFDVYNSGCNTYDSYKNKHFTRGGKLLATYPNDIALVEILGSLDTDKYKYSWIEWNETDKLRCKNTELLGFSYPKENPLKLHEGFLTEKCWIKSGEKLEVSCGNYFSSNGFKVFWEKGSIDKGSSGAALLRKCVLDNDEEKWFVSGVLSAKNKGCFPPDGIFADFDFFIKHSEEGKKILTEGLPDDELEENDNPDEVFFGNPVFWRSCNYYSYFKNLVLKDNDDDWFKFYVGKGCRLTTYINFNEKYGKIVVNLYDKRKKLIKHLENPKKLEYEAYENGEIYMQVSLVGDTYQTYNITFKKKPFINPPVVKVETDLGEPYKTKYERRVQFYKTDKNQVKLHIDVYDDIYPVEKLRICINTRFFGCKNWEKVKPEVILPLKNDRERIYIRVKNPLGQLSKSIMIFIYKK